jgi:GTPase SAR1 family protein
MGSAEVGKSSIVLRYLYDIFSPDYLKTLEDIYMKEDNIEYKPCRIRLLDTSGLDVSNYIYN